MRVRRIAVLIDGGFFLKRLPHLLASQYRTTPQQVAETARLLCKRHVRRLTCAGVSENAEHIWLDHVYRLFYYDALPYRGLCHHPVLNRRIDFSKSETATFRTSLFSELRRKRKFALRLGHVARVDEWRLSHRLTRQALQMGRWLERFDATLREGHGAALSALAERDQSELRQLVTLWQETKDNGVSLGLRQKGVDMRIGLDIASMTLKRQVDTIILVTGDSDFVPAAKLARREGVEFLLDPLWQRISDELTEHVDGVISVFPEPSSEEHALIAA